MKRPGHDVIAHQADEHLVTHHVRLPKAVVDRPIRQVAKRLAMALLLLVATALIVYADHDGYNDNSDGSVDLLDAFYYATVSLSTTGYAVTSASAAGRLLGLSVLSPTAGMVMEDLIQQGSGLDMVERPVIKAEVGKGPRETDDLVVSVVRGHRVLGYDDPAVGELQLTDRLIAIVRSSH